MITVGDLRKMLDKIDDSIEVTIGSSNGMVEVNSVEYNVGNDKTIVLKTNLDNLTGLAETLNQNNGIL